MSETVKIVLVITPVTDGARKYVQISDTSSILMTEFVGSEF